LPTFGAFLLKKLPPTSCFAASWGFTGRPEIEIEANGIFKLRSEGLVIAPFADLDELCQFIKMG
jgi:hypothetical protein